MKTIITISLLTLAIGLHSQGCKKCDLEILEEVYQSMDELTYDLVLKFACSFDSSCRNNAEFSEISNDLLFQIMDKDINLLNKALHDLGFDKVLIICDEIEHPLKDYNYADLYQKVKNSDAPKDMIEEQTRALEKAAAKDGIVLK